MANKRILFAQCFGSRLKPILPKISCWSNSFKSFKPGKQVFSLRREFIAFLLAGSPSEAKFIKRECGFIKGLIDSGLEIGCPEEAFPDEEVLNGKTMKHKINVKEIKLKIDKI